MRGHWWFGRELVLVVTKPGAATMSGTADFESAV
jgi:hypothetical protein